MRRTERINVKKLARKSHQTRNAPPAPAPTSDKEKIEEEPEKSAEKEPDKSAEEENK